MIDHEACHSNPSSLGPLETLTDRIVDISKLGFHDTLGPAPLTASHIPMRYYHGDRDEKRQSRQPTESRCVGVVQRGVAVHTPRGRHCANLQMEGRGAEPLNLTEEQLLLCTPYVCGFAFADKVYCMTYPQGSFNIFCVYGRD